MNLELLDRATKNIRDIINLSILHAPSNNALVVYDAQCGLTSILAEAYRKALPTASFIDFDATDKAEIIKRFDSLKPQDLVVLIQSSSFRLNEFRIRIHLFEKKLKVIEHTHLYRNDENTWDVYVDSLAYDPSWYLTMGPKIKSKLEKTQKLHTKGALAELTVGAIETPKLNIGDYIGMENIGGTFPIGEVFTEAKDFTTMNGSLMIYAYAGNNFTVSIHKPFQIDIREGLIVGWDSSTPREFIDIVEEIKKTERPIIREIGFGLNRAITRERYLKDITAFERIFGMHFSLGEKHSVFKKEGIQTHKARFHVDLFPIVDSVTADGEKIFENEKYLI